MRQLTLSHFSRRKPPPCWVALPDELWVTIFELAGMEACHTSLPRVCKKFEELSQSPVLWRTVTISPRIVKKQSLYSTHEFLSVRPWLAKRLSALQSVEMADFMGCGNSELPVALLQDILVQLADAPQLSTLKVQPTCRGKYNVYGLIAIARLTQLTDLHLEGMSSAVRAPTFEALCTLPALRSLHLGVSRKDERFGGPPALKAVPSGRMSAALRSLSLKGERIRRQHEAAAQLVFRLGDVSSDLGVLRALETLELINCGVTSLPETLGELSALTRLEVLTAPEWPDGTAVLTLPPAVQLPGTISQLSRLQSLSLSSQRLPEDVGCLRSLRELRVSHLGCARSEDDFIEDMDPPGFADVSVEGITAQLTGLSRLAALSSLWLHDCGPNVGVSLDALQGCSAIRRLRLERMCCCDEGPMLDDMCFLSQLELFSMVDVDMECIPEYVAEMVAVTRLDFRLNEDLPLFTEMMISDGGHASHGVFGDTTSLQVLQLGWRRARTLKLESVQALSAIQNALCREDGSCGSIVLGAESQEEEDKDPHGVYMTTAIGVDYY